MIFERAIGVPMDFIRKVRIAKVISPIDPSLIPNISSSADTAADWREKISMELEFLRTICIRTEHRKIVNTNIDNSCKFWSIILKNY